MLNLRNESMGYLNYTGSKLFILRHNLNRIVGMKQISN